MLEAVLQWMTGVLLLLGGALIGAEVLWSRRLDPRVVHRARRAATPPDGWPAIPDAAALEGFEGEGRVARWRWEPATGRLHFGRNSRVVFGERGTMVGYVDVQGDGQIRWHHVGDSLLLLFWAFGTLGGIGLALTDGVPLAAGMGVGLLLPLAFLRVLMMGNASLTLNRAVLPELAGALREHLDRGSP